MGLEQKRDFQVTVWRQTYFYYVQDRIASKNEDEKGMVKSSSNISSIFVEPTPS